MKQPVLLNALLYSDGSNHSLSAAVYAATLMKISPGMKLTILVVQEKFEGSSGSWYVYDQTMEQGVKEVLQKTKAIFEARGCEIEQHLLYGSTTTGDVADTIIRYAGENNCKLIILGTRGPSDLKGLIFGSLAHTVVNRSAIPVLLVKKLPQEFLDGL